MASVFVTKSAEETIELGKKILVEALQEAEKEKSLDGARDKPLVFYLTGELGAGKTYFVKGIAAALGIAAITSPTFVLMKKFKIPGVFLPSSPPSAGRRAISSASLHGKKYFFHIDCYRIYDAQDARQIGLDKIIANPRAIIAIEWAERIEKIILKPYWKVELKYESEEERNITIKYMI